LIDRLTRAGVQYLETTSFVSPKAIPQLRDAAELLARAERGQLRHEVLVPNLKGAQLALEAGADRLVVFMSASEAHNQANVRRSREASLNDLEAVFSLARSRGIPVAGVIAVAFGCPYQGTVPRQDVFQIAGRFADQGADRIALADTTGLANPVQISEMTAAFQGRLPGLELCLHLHNNRGTAMANCYAGYLSGIRMFDASLGGIGGCPNVPQAAGNLATEDVVFFFESMGVATGLDLPGLIQAAQRLETILGHPLPGQVMKSGLPETGGTAGCWSSESDLT
jgi:hydroxymethylglutaryl-CoA lyase